MAWVTFFFFFFFVWAVPRVMVAEISAMGVPGQDQ
jgi:hypothetical protein